jgi:co-chaperonin GroES (HSP10)
MEQKLAFQPNKIKAIYPLGKNVIVCDMNFEHRVTTAGIILPQDDAKSSGIRPRWAKVYAVGPEQTDVKVGEYILVSHGRWTRGIKIEDDEGVKTVRRVDTNDMLMVSDVPMSDETMSDKDI